MQNISKTNIYFLQTLLQLQPTSRCYSKTVQVEELRSYSKKV